MLAGRDCLWEGRVWVAILHKLFKSAFEAGSGLDWELSFYSPPVCWILKLFPCKLDWSPWNLACAEFILNIRCGRAEHQSRPGSKQCAHGLHPRNIQGTKSFAYASDAPTYKQGCPTLMKILALTGLCLTCVKLVFQIARRSSEHLSRPGCQQGTYSL